MDKEFITTGQGVSILILYIIGSAIVISPGIEAKQDVWIAFLIAMIFSLLAIILYTRILVLFPGKDLFDILFFVFGKVLGRVISLFYIWFAFHLGALVLRNFSEFIQAVSLPETPQVIMVAFIGVICIWIVRAGTEVMGRWANFIFPFVSFLIVTMITLSLTEADFNNIKPVLYNGWEPIFSNAFSIFAFPFAEVVVFLMIFSYEKGKFNVFKVFLIGILVGSIILLMAALRNILVLGIDLVSILYFPSYSAVSLINIGGFIQRVEIILSVVFTLGGIIKISVCINAVSNGIVKVFDLDSYRTFAAPIGLLMMNLSCFIYDNTMEMFESASILSFYKIPFLIILPIIIWIASEIKKRIK